MSMNYPIGPLERIKLAATAERWPARNAPDWGWADFDARMRGDLKLERADSSVFHALLQHVLNIAAGKKNLCRDLPIADLAKSQVFVIQHDWAAAFANAEDLKFGEWKLPYPECIFEARLNGLTFCYFLQQDSDGLVKDALFARTQKGWTVFFLPDSQNTGISKAALFIIRQIRACAIMLDAQIAKTEIVRAPEKLNRKREKLGKLPLRDYHIVTLDRSRPQPLPSSEPSGEQHASPRLHFRRGHWRHFANFKTWIRWTLVGDPDLGFIEKRYRL